MRVRSRILSTAALATALTVGLVAAGVAQEATPTTMDEAAGFPAHLHLGTCDALSAEPVERLANLEFPEWVVSLSGEADADIEGVLPDPADFGNPPIPVATSVTEVPVPLADIVAGGHALNIEDPETPEASVACGNVGGIPDERGDLFIGLAESEDSGLSGAAWFHDNGTSTTIVVFLTDPGAQAAIAAGLEAIVPATPVAATPEATPVALTPAEDDTDATPVA
jgi:hypothetical protein